MLALVTIFLLARYAHWLPAIGYVPFFDDPGTNLAQFVFPSIILGSAIAAGLMRFTRSSLLEVMREDYVRTAWAKGLRERTVILRHALRNALIPIITVLGTSVGFLFSGSVLIEQIFNLSGLGRLTLDALQTRDYTVIQGAVLVAGTIVVVTFLVIDLLYTVIDPRIRFSRSAGP